MKVKFIAGAAGIALALCVPLTAIAADPTPAARPSVLATTSIKPEVSQSAQEAAKPNGTATSQVKPADATATTFKPFPQDRMKIAVVNDRISAGGGIAEIKVKVSNTHTEAAEGLFVFSGQQVSEVNSNATLAIVSSQCQLGSLPAGKSMECTAKVNAAMTETYVGRLVLNFQQHDFAAIQISTVGACAALLLRRRG